MSESKDLGVILVSNRPLDELHFSRATADGAGKSIIRHYNAGSGHTGDRTGVVDHEYQDSTIAGP
jgi:hypothetical protein